MKTAKLEIHNINGEVVHEDNIVIESGDKLIINVPINATMESIETIFNNVKFMMENEDVNVVVLPEEVTLKVLKIN